MPPASLSCPWGVRIWPGVGHHPWPESSGHCQGSQDPRVQAPLSESQPERPRPLTVPGCDCPPARVTGNPGFSIKALCPLRTPRGPTLPSGSRALRAGGEGKGGEGEGKRGRGEFGGEDSNAGRMSRGDPGTSRFQTLPPFSCDLQEVSSCAEESNLLLTFSQVLSTTVITRGRFRNYGGIHFC